jgi:hypothetical protein
VKKQVIITVGKDGETKIEAAGYSGGLCLKATESARAALHGQVGGTRELTSDYYRPVVEPRLMENEQR